ncbi:MAG: hypothetical protein Q4Q31_04700 [Bacillota bacterium]|nr:hypothetical protein [Bacillota bacterium]
MAQNVKFDEDTLKTYGEKISKHCEDIQGIITSYQKTLSDILSTAIMQGDTAKSLAEFKTHVDTLNNLISPIGKQCEGLTKHYLKDVDSADEYLY